MTENPVPGASPEPTQQNREPAGQQAGPPEQTHAASAPEAAPSGSPAPGQPAAGSSAPENPTLRLDRAEDGAPRPVYQQQPSVADTQQFGAPAVGLLRSRTWPVRAWCPPVRGSIGREASMETRSEKVSSSGVAG